MKSNELKTFLDEQVERFNHPDFIETDPISVPHGYASKQDIEIAGLIAAIFAWGNRTTIIRKSNEFLALMDNEPHAFVLHHSADDLKGFEGFVHRTFQPTDALYLIHFLHVYYSENESLETAFLPQAGNIEKGLIHFHRLIFADPLAPERTRKHFTTPERNSSCKRLNMFLRWMIRKDDKGVDFGIWKQHDPAHLICPIDLHVQRVAGELGLIGKRPANWKTALHLTEILKQLDPNDPVKYDFALYGLGMSESALPHSSRH